MLVTLAVGSATTAAAQGFLESFSYDGLQLSGIGFDLGGQWSDRLTNEMSGSLRVDYGLIAPNIRLMLGASYFKARLNDDEIAEFERSLQGVVVGGPVTIDVGQINWTNFETSFDLQYMIPTGAGSRWLPYVGGGLSVHLRNGSGQAINGTFVEDALDTVAAAANLVTGIEVAIQPHINLTSEVRGGLSSELLTVSARFGLMYRIRGWMGR